MAGAPWRIRVEYPGGPTWGTRVMDVATGERVEGVSAVRWALDANAPEAAPYLSVVVYGRTLRFELDSFECEAEAAE